MDDASTEQIQIVPPKAAIEHVSLQGAATLVWARKGQQATAKSLFRFPKHRRD